MSDVPCNGCTLCCHRDTITMLPGDDAASYKTVPHERIKGALMLDHKANDDCIYLGDSGCTIYERRPQLCRDMDCRNIPQRYTFTQARTERMLPLWKRGKYLLMQDASKHA